LAVSPRAKRQINDAFDKLKTVVENTHPHVALDFADITMDDVKRTAREIEKDLARKQSLRNMRRITPFFEGLERYAKMIEALCDGTTCLPWLWASGQLQRLDELQLILPDRRQLNRFFRCGNIDLGREN
jgi:hypothetical protein